MRACRCRRRRNSQPGARQEWRTAVLVGHGQQLQPSGFPWACAMQLALALGMPAGMPTPPGRELAHSLYHAGCRCRLLLLLHSPTDCTASSRRLGHNPAEQNIRHELRNAVWNDTAGQTNSSGSRQYRLFHRPTWHSNQSNSEQQPKAPATQSTGNQHTIIDSCPFSISGHIGTCTTTAHDEGMGHPPGAGARCCHAAGLWSAQRL